MTSEKDIMDQCDRVKNSINNYFLAESLEDKIHWLKSIQNEMAILHIDINQVMRW